MQTCQSNRVCEFVLNAPHDFVEFARPDGVVLSVPAFFAGNNTWKVRYASGVLGVHTSPFGDVEITPYSGENPLYKHGGIQRAPGQMHLEYADGTPFYWLADTQWMSLCSRLTFLEFAELCKDRVAKGFSVVQIVAGLYPDMLPFDPRGANEAGFPFNEDFTKINPAYFDAAERRILHLIDAGITPCIFGCWGFFMKFAGKDALKRHWQYLIARFGAYPVAFSLAGEANMAFYDDDGGVSRDEHLKQSRRDWGDIGRFVHSLNAFSRLITVHPTQYGHEQLDDESLLDLDMLQTGHGGATSLVDSMRMLKSALDRKALPVINSEACYEGICGSSYADVQRYLYLSAFMLGACGHTYGANGIWQVNTENQPYGVSPHGAHWGDTSLIDAANLPGSQHIGQCARFLTRFNWQNFTYHPEWVERPCSLTALDGHFAAGIPGEVRVIFKPHFGGDFWGEIQVFSLEKPYRAGRFNPISGAYEDLGMATPDASGAWRFPRINAFQDWIYVLEA